MSSTEEKRSFTFVCCIHWPCFPCYQPIGALNPTRLHKYEKRYNNFEDDSMAPFFYGTHYSTMGAVLHWLVRVVRIAGNNSFFLFISLSPSLSLSLLFFYWTFDLPCASSLPFLYLPLFLLPLHTSLTLCLLSLSLSLTHTHFSL